MTHSYDYKFTHLLAELEKNPERLEQFARQPLAFLTDAGIPLIESQPDVELSGDETPAITAKQYWWGIDIIMNERMTQGIATGTDGGAATTALVTAALGYTAVGAALTAGLLPLIGAAIASAFLLKAAQIRLTDAGKGVHWPITWLQWATVVAAAPGGPASIGVALLVFFHPLPN